MLLDRFWIIIWIATTVSGLPFAPNQRFVIDLYPRDDAFDWTSPKLSRRAAIPAENEAPEPNPSENSPGTSHEGSSSGGGRQGPQDQTTEDTMSREANERMTRELWEAERQRRLLFYWIHECRQMDASKTQQQCVAEAKVKLQQFLQAEQQQRLQQASSRRPPPPATEDQGMNPFSLPRLNRDLSFHYYASARGLSNAIRQTPQQLKNVNWAVVGMAVQQGAQQAQRMTIPN